MLGAAGAGGEAALVARLNLALVLADARRRCDAGLAPALPLVHEVLTEREAALLVAALADALGHEAVGADVGRDAARPAPARPVPAVPALGPDTWGAAGKPELPLGRWRHLAGPRSRPWTFQCLSACVC